jgi:hypothetical protein
MSSQKTILIYHPQKLPNPRAGSLNLDGVSEGRRVKVRLKPGQNKVDPKAWEAIKARQDVLDLLNHDKAIVEVEPKAETEKRLDAKGDRLLELQTADWRDLRDTAKQYGIEKDDSEPWESVIPAILEAEGLS